MDDLIPNRLAARTFLDRHGLNRAPTGRSPQDILHDLSFVQVDSINTAARAHDLIMWTRCQSYRPNDLRNLVDHDRTAFEGWTHDASIISMSHYGHWKHKFNADKTMLERRWKSGHRGDFLAQIEKVLDQITSHGPAGSGDVGKDEKRGTGGWWDWHPSKTALEYLWRTGQIAVTRREGFRKIYDLSENVIPAAARAQETSWAETLEWACRTALSKLGFATAKEIADFFELVPLADAKHWVGTGLKSGELSPINIKSKTSKNTIRVCYTNEFPVLFDTKSCAKRARVLSPFDPAIRNRNRALDLFGFDYRIEIFVPQAKRQYGYYVYPVLYGQNFIGRIEVKANRTNATLDILGYWPEQGARHTPAALSCIFAELTRLCKLADCTEITGHSHVEQALSPAKYR